MLKKFFIFMLFFPFLSQAMIVSDESKYVAIEKNEKPQEYEEVVTAVRGLLQRVYKTNNKIKEDVNQTFGQEERSAIFYTVENNMPDFTETLLDHGAKVNFMDKDKRTPLSFAADPKLPEQEIYIELADLLLKKQKDGDNSLSIAEELKLKEFELKRNNLMNTAESLVKECMYLDSSTFAERIKLEHVKSVKMISVHIAQMLLDRGARIDIQNKHGNTPIMFAIKNGFVNIVELLINKGADLNITNEHKMNTLLYAVKTGNLEIIELLLNTNAKINLTSKKGKTWRDYANEIVDNDKRNSIISLIEPRSNLETNELMDEPVTLDDENDNNNDDQPLIIKKHSKKNIIYGTIKIRRKNSNKKLSNSNSDKYSNTNTKNKPKRTKSLFFQSNKPKE